LRKHTINIFLLGFVFINLLEGCTSTNESQASSCIPENKTTNYEPGLRRQEEYTVSHRKPMPSWWAPQLNETQLNVEMSSARDIVAQSGDTIWIATTPDNSGTDEPKNSIIRYRTDTGEIKAHELLDENGFGRAVLDLFATHDGNLWIIFITNEYKHEYSILARYDPQKDEFSVVADRDRLLSPPTNIEMTWDGSAQPVISETPDESLVVALNGEIFLYYSATNEAKRILGRDKGLDVKTIATSKDGHIWFITGNDFSIRELDPVDGTIWNYGPPPGITSDDSADRLTSMSKAIEIDDAGRVWVSDYGWLEPSQKTRYMWHPIARSPIFIHIDDPEYKYLWIRPEALYQFSDGNMWYQSGIGIVQFNMQSGSWCWKATESGPLAEDMNGNIWLVAHGQIYKYALRP
jgi:hypothetical protein